MSKKLFFRFTLATIPLVIGLVVLFVFHLVFPQVPLLVFKADVGSAAAVLCGILSLVLFSWILGWGTEYNRGLMTLNEERTQHETSRRRFIRRLDHELKNPLTGLRAALVNLKSLLSSECNQLQATNIEDTLIVSNDGTRAANFWPEANRTLTDAEYQIERLSRLVADLRKLAELEVRPLETSQVNLAELLDDTVEAVCSLPAYANRKIQVVIPRVPWPLPVI
ncbi:MAG: hypothetical protein IH586_09895, partial [Anaerolineaceae bacterium]|nr:hypothetical protein [Anaerolineaceae bacterium]